LTSQILTDATDLTRQLRARQISAVETVRAAIERIERLNPAINAVVTTTFDESLAAAEEADRRARVGDWLGPLHGVPILIKDLFDFKAGVRNTFGCRAMTDYVPDQTVAYVERLEQAGGIVIGKTNTPEFGHKGITDNNLFGPTRNPFDLTKNAGGSSGGSAAAVAVGMVPIAQGTDAGGSIRIPAAWCGVVGFKPTFGRIPLTGGANAFGAHTPFVHAGSLTRSVRDAALMTQVMSGAHWDDPFSLPDDGMNLIAAAETEPGPLRLAFSRDLGVFAVEPSIAAEIERCIESLRDSGIEIEEVVVALPLDQDELAQLWCREVGVLYLEMFDSMASSGLDLLADFADDIPEAIHAMVDRARRSSVLELRRDEILRTKIWRTIQQVFRDFDGVLTPTLSALPVPNASDGGTLGPAFVAGKAVERTIGWCLTHPFNFTGHPAASLPAGLTNDGLPVGLQVVGRRFADEQLISLCAAIERARPWSGTLDNVVAQLETNLKSLVASSN
jgi:amidase